MLIFLITKYPPNINIQKLFRLYYIYLMQEYIATLWSELHFAFLHYK